MVSRKFFVTGASGLLGAYIVKKLLDAGHSVRGSARGAKVAQLKKIFASYEKFEVADIPDLSDSDLSLAFAGCDVLIHTAAFLPSFRGDIEFVRRFSTTGTEYILDAARAAGIKTVVATGSQVTYEMDGPVGPRDWRNVTFEYAAKQTEQQHFWVYIAQKVKSEQTMIEWAEKHLDTKVVIIDPTYIFGPFVPDYKYIVEKPELYSLESSNYLIHFFIRAENVVFAVYPGWMDVRNVADAHINAVDNKAIEELPVKDRRFIVAAPEPHDWKKAIAYLKEARPQLANRLSDPAIAPVWPTQVTDLDRTEKYLGIKKDGYVSWKDSLVDAVDSILLIEDYWREQGFEVKLPNQSLFN